jgi:hypothetical protein
MIIEDADYNNLVSLTKGIRERVKNLDGNDAAVNEILVLLGVVEDIVTTAFYPNFIT